MDLERGWGGFIERCCKCGIDAEEAREAMKAWSDLYPRPEELAERFHERFSRPDDEPDALDKLREEEEQAFV
jgi:hypothetical protein